MTCILSATDFSDSSRLAANIAGIYAKALEGEVRLLHILPESPAALGGAPLMQYERLFKDAADHLQKEADRQSAAQGIPTGFAIQDGHLFTAIQAAEKDTGADLMFMATHGKKGIQHIVGSFAGKVLARSPIPVIVTQGHTPETEPTNILVYIDFTRKSKELVEWAIRIGKAFNATLRILVNGNVSDYPDQKVDLSQRETAKMLDEAGLIYKFVPLDTKTMTPASEVLMEARSAKSQLIIIPRSKSDSGFGKPEQTLITNSEGIPVLIMGSGE